MLHIYAGFLSPISIRTLILLFHLWSVVGHRLPKALDMSCLFAVEMPDLCTVPRICTTAESLPYHIFQGSTFAVEIKVCCGSSLDLTE